MLVAIFVWILALAQFDDISNLGPTYKGDDRLAQWHLHLGENNRALKHKILNAGLEPGHN